ncbi:hypothetical protein [Pseudomonas quasicaspiana]|uniref:hypothetical protein n=1 Tax=Pseudomonas quasicaspiana TaxID=2829821 RepID=UPI001E3C030D|nr:hypothetical protein [Pseudomonas quasicaspiana]MCD5977194.1 hypothetical protein [Pseudomonas quasicaspiana]
MLKDHLSTTALVVGLALSFISLKQWFSAPAIDLSASVESSIYKSHPSIQAFIDEPLKDSTEIEDNLKKNDAVKNLSLTNSQTSWLAEQIRQNTLSIKHSFNWDARTFLVYKIDNAGDKAATGVALVNFLDGVAKIDGNTKPIKVSEKEAIELGEISPRSSKTVYFWTSDYYYHRGDDSYVKYSEGAIDIDTTLPLGGIYRHFHEFALIYQTLIGAAALFSLIVFIAEKFFGKTTASPVSEITKPRRKRRRRRSQAKTNTQTQD